MVKASTAPECTVEDPSELAAIAAFYKRLALALFQVRNKAKMRAFIQLNHGKLSPVGADNIKTRSPSTYRKVGGKGVGTCHASCPHLVERTCYAMFGNVGMHMRRDQNDRDEALRAAAWAMVSAARSKRESIARLHVSGDFADSTTGQLDWLYIAGLVGIAEAVRETTGKKWAAWSYTHLPAGQWLEDLRHSGIAVRVSDKVGIWGAVTVEDRAHARELRSSRQPVAVCPAQLGDTDCASCKLCWERPDYTIAFLAHGSAKKRAARWVRAARAT